MLLMASVAYSEEVPAIITFYDACEICCPPFKGKIKGQTASGKMAKQGRTIAAPKDIPFGTEIVIGGKSFIVEDRGEAIKYVGDTMKIDVYVKTHKQARKLGTYVAMVNIKR